MPNNSLLLLAVLIVVCVVMVAVFFGLAGYFVWKSQKRQAESLVSSKKMTEALDGVLLLLKSLQPALVAMAAVDTEYASRAEVALNKLGERQLSEIIRLTGSVNKFEKTFSGFMKTIIREPKDALQQPTDEDASLQYEIDEYVSKGLSREEARARAEFEVGKAFGAEIPGRE